jgi:hypothetical protein
MIMKDSCSVAIKILRQEQSLPHHADAGEVVYMLNPKFHDLVLRPPGSVGRRPLPQAARPGPTGGSLQDGQELPWITLNKR